MESAEIRQKFIDFFAARGHKEIANMPLIPENDPTTLFIGSGMQPLVPYLLGEAHPQGNRLVNVQRSFRAEDLDEVGNERHHTLFEMLGFWSLGDYFKEKAIPWTLEFFVNELNLDPKRLYITVFAGDEYAGRDTESVEIWKKTFKEYGIEAVDTEDLYAVGQDDFRIFYYSRKKNWWERSNAPVGDPGGPSSEVFYFTGKEHDIEFGEKCHINCDCGRYVEIANDVFMEYEKTKDGYKPLKKKNVDAGWGLERIARIVQDKQNNFETDLFYPIIKKTGELSTIKYGESEKADWVYKIIADHTRASVFLIADGVTPSNKMQGYMLRRLLRRIIRFSRELETEQGFLQELAKTVINSYKKSYPYLDENRDRIIDTISKEEKKFQKTLDRGLKELEKILEDGELTGADAFMLYETHGFPLELTVEVAQEKGLLGSAEEGQQLRDQFDAAKVEAVNKSKQLDKGVFQGGLGDDSEKTVWFHTLTHLLHQALIKVLGEHVKQEGSNITAERLRFDFSHDRKMTDEEISRIEDIVNEQKNRNLPVTKEVMGLQEALDSGAKAFFKEKYDDKVSVYSIGDFSREICGGPHVRNTSEIEGKFKIIKEESVGAGKRRVKAVLVS